jgi:cysteinyl-tRNA synthetase
MQLYNTLTRTREPFSPAGDAVKMYVCGPTVYDRSHLGHALSAITFDVLHRYLEFRGQKVRRVMNFTDVDDKIIERAHRDGEDAIELAERHIEAFFEDIDGLNVRRATVHPKATDEIPQIVDLIRLLTDIGAAYEAQGSVYFNVKSDPDYGKLSRRTFDEMLGGGTPEPGKRFGADFALWKAAKPGEPAWDSPWGRGRPGWHIECSAMALHHLGEQLDIHGGGLDLIFPHHENEIAQSETALGVEPFARVWMHNGMMRRPGDEKMSKSLGNSVYINDALASNSSDAIRIWILQGHYRSPSTLEDDSLERGERAMRSLRIALELESPRSDNAVDASPHRERFIQAMDDDLNTPQAVAALFDLRREINRGRDAGESVADAQATLRELGGVLGLTFQERVSSAGNGLSDAEIQELISERDAARKERRFADADAVRDKLQAAGVSLTDSPDGTRWARN